MKAAVMCVCLMFLLSGCLYPQDQLEENRVPYKDQIQTVQTAVNEYQKDTGVLPIVNRDENTDFYEKYPVDFSKLVPRYLQQPPGNSFEKGGTFQYVILNAEKKPEVRLIDLVLANKVQDVQLALDTYMKKYHYPPFKDVIANGRYTIYFNKIGYKEDPYVISPFTGRNLPLLVDSNAKVFVDYSMDLYSVLKKSKHIDNEKGDIRQLLADESFFSPAYSVPYTLKNNEPVFLIK